MYRTSAPPGTRRDLGADRRARGGGRGRGVRRDPAQPPSRPGDDRPRLRRARRRPTMTTPLLRGSDLHGRPVVDLSTGEDVAEVRDVVFDVGGGRITGFTLNKRGGLFAGRLKAVLPAGEVRSVGTDAV